jgi:hypothetical protein
MGTKRFWASVQVIHKESGVCVGEDNSQMTWPLLLANGSYGRSNLTNFTSGTNRITFIKIIPSVNGFFLSLRIFIHSGAGMVTIGLYDDNLGLPNNLLISSGLLSLGSPPNLVTFSFNSEIPFLAGSTYWLAAVSSGVVVYDRSFEEPIQKTSTDPFNFLPNPAPSVDPNSNKYSFSAGVFNII